jgi:hypothetical protein
MVRRILVFLLILCSSLLYSQSSTKPESVYTHCFTDTEWAAFEEEVWSEEQATVTEAVNAAVEPYKLQVNVMDREIRWLKIGIITIGVVGLAGWIWAAVK